MLRNKSVIFDINTVQLHQNFKPLKIKWLRNAAGYLSVLIFEVVFVTY